MLDIYKVRDSKEKIINGDVFRKYNIQDEAKPIFTGTALKTGLKSFNISSGDLWNYRYKSIGTLKSNYVLPGKSYIDDAPLNLNNCVILPVPDTGNSYNNVKSNAIINGFFIKVNINDVNKVKNSIYERFKNDDVDVNVVTVEEDLNNYIRENEEYFIAQLRITLCLLLLSTMGTATTLILSVKRRKREFGIRISTGGSKFYLLRLIYGEVMLILIISYIIALLYYSKGNSHVLKVLGKTTFQIFNPLFSIIYLLCVFAIIVILSFSVVIIILKMQPRDLIGGVK